MSKKILGIDPSTRMGLVVLDYEPWQEGGKTSFVRTLYQAEYKSKHTGMQRLGDIGQRIIDLIGKYEPDLVGLEGYSYGSKFNHESMYSIGTVIRYFMWQNEIDYKEIPPSTLKKFVTGKGNAKKDLMMVNVYKNWGFDSANDNVVDAYALAMFTLFNSLGIADDKGVWLKGDAKQIKII